MSAEDPLEGSGFTYQEMRVIFERAGISEATRSAQPMVSADSEASIRREL